MASRFGDQFWNFIKKARGNPYDGIKWAVFTLIIGTTGLTWSKSMMPAQKTSTVLGQLVLMGTWFSLGISGLLSSITVAFLTTELGIRIAALLLLAANAYMLYYPISFN